MPARIRVLAIDDSSVARENYRQMFSGATGIDLIDVASNAETGRKKLLAKKPDVIILDIDMPGIDGITFLKWVMRSAPVPVVVASSLDPQRVRSAVHALSIGAVAVVPKNGQTAGNGGPEPRSFQQELFQAIREAGVSRSRRLSAARPLPPPSVRFAVPADSAAAVSGTVVVIGASTGGTEAIARLVTQMPPDFPPVFVVQHMPPVFTASFADRLNELGQIHVSEAKDGTVAGRGEMLIAPGGYQMEVRKSPNGIYSAVKKGPLVNGHAPSVDVLFRSAARYLGSDAIGVILTGMGDDGAAGLLEMKNTGAYTIAQDNETSVVYGMPMEAAKIGAASSVLGLDQIVPRILSARVRRELRA